MSAGADTLFYFFLLLLPVAALIARRPPLGTTIRIGLAWLAIFAVALWLVGQRDRLPSWLTLGNEHVRGEAVRVSQSRDGHFWINAEIDGLRRRMLIDSGATTTALLVDTAQAIGLDVEQSTFPVVLETANGRVMARVAMVSNLKLGKISAHDLGVVVSPAFGDVDVIGMNFLSRLKEWRIENNTLTMQP